MLILGKQNISFTIFTEFSGRFPFGVHLFKVDNGNPRAMCEICSQLTVETPEWCQWRRSGVLIVNFEQISLLFWCFRCVFWTSKETAGCYLNLPFTNKISPKSPKSHNLQKFNENLWKFSYILFYGSLLTLVSTSLIL